MHHSSTTIPIRQRSRRPCACCGEYRSVGVWSRGRWVELSTRFKESVCWACFRALDGCLIVGRPRPPAVVSSPELDLAA